MPKPKLTPAEKSSLRKELKAKVAAGVSRSEILKTLSKKYGISSEGMRYYLKGESTGKKAPKAKKENRGSKSEMAPKSTKKAAKGPAKKRSPSPKATSNGHAAGLPAILKELSEKHLTHLLAAQKLVPALEASRRREGELRDGVRRLGRELRAESAKARKIHREIKRLARV
jgi:hypothetical protein